MSRFGLGLLTALVLMVSPAVGQGISGDVVINEIMYAPTPSSNEFVELYNRSDQPVDLRQLALADANRSFTALTSKDTTLAPGAYAVLVRDPEAFHDAYPDVDGFTIDDWEALNNGGDTVFLRHESTETMLDSVPYDPSWGGDDGRSLERIDPDGPSTTDRNFATSEAGATPGAQNSVFNPDETPPVPERVTPSRQGDSLFVVFSEPLDPARVSAGRFELKAAEAPAVASAQVASSAPSRVRCALASPLSTGEYTLAVSGVADRRGNVLDEGEETFSFFVAEAPAPGDVVITELMYAPSSSSTEFIELYNRSEKTIDLGTLRYADTDRDFNRAAAPLTALAPESYVVLVRDSAAFSTHFPAVDAQSPPGWDALNNGGDTVLLRYGPSAIVLDSVPYEPSWGGENGNSLERIDPRGPSDVASNFATSTADRGATPGARNSQHNRDTASPTPTFAEMVGATTVEVVFDEPVDPESVTPGSFSFDATTVMAASLPSPRSVQLELSGPPSTSTLRVIGIQDRVGNILAETPLTLAYRPTPADVVVNEIMYAPRADDFDDRPNQVEYVELYNIGNRPITLNGLVLTDRPTEDGVADTIRAGRRRAVRSGSFAVVAAAPAGSTQIEQSQLAAAFPNVPLASDSVTYLPVDASRLGLQNDGDLIRVHRADGSSVAEVTYSPDWHASGLADPEGTSLARITTGGDPNAARNWTSSTSPVGGTPGAPNAVSVSPPDGAPSAPGLRIQPNPFSIERDGATRIQYALTDVPNLVRARIFDARGRKVRTVEDARLAGQSGVLVWDGRNDAGNRVRMGIYVILFEAIRAEAGERTRLKETVVFARPFD